MSSSTAEATLTERHHASRAAAEAMHRLLTAATGANDRGIKASRFAILDQASVPAVMIELGFVTHPVEGPRLADADYQDALAHALATGIREYLSRAPGEPRAAGPAAPGAAPFAKAFSYAELGAAGQQE